MRRGALVLSVLLLPAAVWAEDRQAFEAEMFGAPASAAPDARENALFGGAATAAGAASPGGPAGLSAGALGIAERVDEADDNLDLGGLLYLRGTYRIERDGDPERAALAAPSWLDVYLDGRPTDRVRAYVRGRLSYDATVTAGAADMFGRPVEGLDVALDQMWLKFDIARTAFVTVGKQPLRFGVGRFWNPTDFLNPTRRDPLAVIDERLGVSLVKLHLPFEARGINLYAIGDFEGSRAPDEVGAAVRAEVLVGQTEFAVSGYHRKDRPITLGADVSSGVGPFDLYVEAAAVHLDPVTSWTGNLDLARRPFPELPQPVDRRADWIPQVVAGVETSFNISDEDSLLLAVEYFFNDGGSDRPDLFPWQLFRGTYRPLYYGRHYAAASLIAMGPGALNDTTFIASTLGNFSDRSWLSRIDVRHAMLSFLSLDTWAALHYGRAGEFNPGFTLPPFPLIPQLAQGVNVQRPLLDLGVGIRTSF